MPVSYGRPNKYTFVPPLCGPLKSSALALSYFRPSPQASRRAAKFTVADLRGR